MRRDRNPLYRPNVETAAAPAWVVTYADLVTLLLCLFVAILSMSTIQPDRFQTALGSLQEAFGSVSAPESADTADQTIYGRLRKVTEPRTSPESSDTDAGSLRPWASVSRIPMGALVTLAGLPAFERGKGELEEAARQKVIQVAEEIKGRNCRIVVRGHSAGESPEAAPSLRDLSYARAAAAARLLELEGVPAGAISVVALGDGQPLLDHAYTEKRRAMNRRVEIEIVERDESSGLDRQTQVEKG